MFVETKFFHKAGEGSGGGGGGSDPHNLGYYADLTALQTAHPTGTDGDFAILGSTDTIWVWDSGTSAWKDTDTKGQVTSVNGQTGAVTVDTLPSQTGQSGKFLTTNGTSASWEKALQNMSTGTDSLSIGAGPFSNNYSINIGPFSSLNPGSQFGTAVGVAASSGYYGVAYGYGAVVNVTGTDQSASAIQLGWGTNTVGKTVQFWDIRVLDADGTIPKERLTNVVTTPATAPVLAVADWSSNTQTITVTGVTATNTVFVAPAPASAADYAAAGILCTAQAADSLTFTCTTVPSNAITLSVVILG